MSTDVLIPLLASENRTNVRKQQRDRAIFARAWPLRALLAFSPKLAARSAARAFFTTYRPPVRPQEAALLDLAERFTIPFGRAQLPAWSFGDGPTVLLSHGWSGRGAQMAPLAAALATAGFRAVVFDHPAHGEARGAMTTLPEMAHALAVVDGWLGGAHAIVAHSLGSIAATLALARTITPRRVVFLAPPIESESWLVAFARKLGLGPAIDAPLREAAEKLAGVKLGSLDPRPIAPTLEQPLLVVHDRGDDEIPFASGQALVHRWRGAELMATEGLGHYRTLRDPVVGERILRFLSPLVRR